jgi:hypothetical protein
MRKESAKAHTHTRSIPVEGGRVTATRTASGGCGRDANTVTGDGSGQRAVSHLHAGKHARYGPFFRRDKRGSGHEALVQLFLNCPAVNPDEAGQEVDVDEFAHTGVGKQARCDQLRVPEALARRDQQRALATLQAKEDAPTPAQAPAADDGPPTGSRALFMEMRDFCVATSVVTDDVTAGLIKQAKIKLTTEVQALTHPAQLSDGGGADVGGAGAHQTQDIDAEKTAANPRRRDNHRPSDPECRQRACR